MTSTMILQIIVLAGVAVAGLGDAQSSQPSVKDDLFSGTEKFAVNATSAEQVDMDSNSLSLVEGKNAAKIRDVILSIVHRYTYDKPGQYSMDDVNSYRKKLEGPDWHCSIRRWDNKAGTSTDICSKIRPGGLFEYAVISVKPTQLTFIHTLRKSPH